MPKKPEWMPDEKPVLRDYEGRWDKRWYIQYTVWHTDKRCFVKRRKWIPSLMPVSARRKWANEALRDLKRLIAEGYMAGNGKYREDPTDPDKLTVEMAIAFFMNQKNGTGELLFQMPQKHNPATARVSHGTFRCYRTCLVNTLLPWLTGRHEHDVLLRDLPKQTLQEFFHYLKTERGLDPTTLNAYRGYLSTFYNHFIKYQELDLPNRTRNVERYRDEDSERHPPYSDEQLAKITAECERDGEAQLLLFLRFIYYLFIRPGTELRLLRVGDIRERTVYIRPANAKNDRGQHITIPDALEELIQAASVRRAPQDWYVFGAAGKPGRLPKGKNYFYKKHKLLLDRLGYHTHTLYGYKHTGAINLYTHTRDIATVQRHCRHATQRQTEQYLRGLGVLVEQKVLAFKGF